MDATTKITLYLAMQLQGRKGVHLPAFVAFMKHQGHNPYNFVTYLKLKQKAVWPILGRPSGHGLRWQDYPKIKRLLQDERYTHTLLQWARCNRHLLAHQELQRLPFTLHFIYRYLLTPEERRFISVPRKRHKGAKQPLMFHNYIYERRQELQLLRTLSTEYPKYANWKNINP